MAQSLNVSTKLVLQFLVCASVVSYVVCVVLICSSSFLLLAPLKVVLDTFICNDVSHNN